MSPWPSANRRLGVGGDVAQLLLAAHDGRYVIAKAIPRHWPLDPARDRIVVSNRMLPVLM